MSLPSSHSKPHQVYFCTITCYKWLPLIDEADAYRSVYRWFDFIKNEGCKLVGYVIMPNHFHLLLCPTHSGASVSQMIGACKRFLAYDIVSALNKRSKTHLLSILRNGVAINERRKGKLHQVFKPSFDRRMCFNEKMIEEKLDYIHYNPLRGKWRLVEDFATFPHSSAAFYELNAASGVEITHYKDLCFHRPTTSVPVSPDK